MMGRILAAGKKMLGGNSFSDFVDISDSAFDFPEDVPAAGPELTVPVIYGPSGEIPRIPQLTAQLERLITTPPPRPSPDALAAAGLASLDSCSENLPQQPLPDLDEAAFSAIPADHELFIGYLHIWLDDLVMNVAEEKQVKYGVASIAFLRYLWSQRESLPKDTSTYDLQLLDRRMPSLRYLWSRPSTVECALCAMEAHMLVLHLQKHVGNQKTLDAFFEKLVQTVVVAENVEVSLSMHHFLGRFINDFPALYGGESIFKALGQWLRREGETLEALVCVWKMLVVFTKGAANFDRKSDLKALWDLVVSSSSHTVRQTNPGLMHAAVMVCAFAASQVPGIPKGILSNFQRIFQGDHYFAAGQRVSFFFALDESLHSTFDYYLVALDAFAKSLPGEARSVAAYESFKVCLTETLSVSIQTITCAWYVLLVFAPHLPKKALLDKASSILACVAKDLDTQRTHLDGIFMLIRAMSVGLLSTPLEEVLSTLMVRLEGVPDNLSGLSERFVDQTSSLAPKAPLSMQITLFKTGKLPFNACLVKVLINMH